MAAAAAVAPPPPPDGPLFLGIDVGTGSARAGVFDSHGGLLAVADRPIQIYRVEGQPLLYQQSSDNIWRALCAAVREAVEKADAAGAGAGAGAGAARIAALSVTATCSMVVVGAGGRPLDVTPRGARVTPPLPVPASDDEGVPNIIMWLDHRALAEAEAITATAHPLLRHVGGVISPENEVCECGVWGMDDVVGACYVLIYFIYSRLWRGWCLPCVDLFNICLLTAIRWTHWFVFCVTQPKIVCRPPSSSSHCKTSRSPSSAGSRRTSPPSTTTPPRASLTWRTTSPFASQA
jgi:hypothetical protein